MLKTGTKENTNKEQLQVSCLSWYCSLNLTKESCTAHMLSEIMNQKYASGSTME